MKNGRDTWVIEVVVDAVPGTDGDLPLSRVPGVASLDMFDVVYAGLIGSMYGGLG